MRVEKKAFAYRVHIGDYNYLQCISYQNYQQSLQRLQNFGLLCHLLMLKVSGISQKIIFCQMFSMKKILLLKEHYIF